MTTRRNEFSAFTKQDVDAWVMKKNKTLENNAEQTDLHGRKKIKQNNNSWNFLSNIPFWKAISFELELY